MSEPLYPRLLQLKNIHPNAWQRAALGEGMAALGFLLALADLASAWSILVLPIAVAFVVKAHDVITGLLPRRAHAVAVPRPGSQALWALLERGSREADDVPPPFALLETDEGVQRVAPPAGPLTATELAGALREGVRAAAPTRAVLVREGSELEGYEDGLAHGLLVAPSLDVLQADLPPVLVTPASAEHRPPPALLDADPEPVAVRVVEPEPEPVVVRLLEPEPEVSVRIIPAHPQPEPEPEPEPDPNDVGSDALWALLWAAKERTEAGAEVPFALVEVVEGEVVEVRAPVLAAVLLTPDEQAGALRSGLVDLTHGSEAPQRAVLVYKQGAQLVGYEPGLATGIVVAAVDLALVPVDVPNVF